MTACTPQLGFTETNSTTKKIYNFFFLPLLGCFIWTGLHSLGDQAAAQTGVLPQQQGGQGHSEQGDT